LSHGARNVQDEHQVKRVLFVEERLNGLDLSQILVNAGHLLGEVEHLVNFNILILLREFLDFLSGLGILCFLVLFVRLNLCFWRSQNQVLPVFGFCRGLRQRYLDFVSHLGTCLLLFDLLSSFWQGVREFAARAKFARTFLEVMVTLLLLLS
jgi:hypothetical protein